MAEFGENLKRIREEKGLTQQTLADYLFVTRQAVSRWEGGSRYPDLMTAKKMSQFLGVTLDELLSDDDMKLYVEKNAILEGSVAKRAQIVLIALSFMASLAVCILYLSAYLFPGTWMLGSRIEFVKSILLTLILGYGIYAAICDKLNPKFASMISALFLGTAIVTGIMGIILEDRGLVRLMLLGAMVFDIFFLVVCVRFFCGKKAINPIWLYMTAGVYGFVGIAFLVMRCMLGGPVDIMRVVVIYSVFPSIEGLLLITLLIFMAYVLDKKRKLAAR